VSLRRIFLTQNQIVNRVNIVTALNEMQTRSSDENYVCPSVRLSVNLSVCPDFYTIRKIIQPSFLRRRMVGGGRPLLHEILGKRAADGAKSPILNRHSFVAPQP